jgi:hypothetical protein
MERGKKQSSPQSQQRKGASEKLNDDFKITIA